MNGFQDSHTLELLTDEQVKELYEKYDFREEPRAEVLLARAYSATITGQPLTAMMCAARVLKEINYFRANQRQLKDAAYFLIQGATEAVEDARRNLTNTEASLEEKKYAAQKLYRIRGITIASAELIGFSKNRMAPNRVEAHDLLEIWKKACKYLGDDPASLLREALPDMSYMSPLRSLAKSETALCSAKVRQAAAAPA